MKKLSSFLCALALLLSLSPRSLAAGPAGEVEVQFYNETAGQYDPLSTNDRVQVTLDGTPLELDVPALTRTLDGVDGRTLVPVRPIAEALGCTVLWLGETRQVTLFRGEDTVILTLGSDLATVNGQQVQLPGGVPAGIAKVDGVERTLVPLRFLSEELGAGVEWDNATFTAAVTSPLPEPEPTPVLPPEETTPPAGYLTAVEGNDNTDTVTLRLSAPPRYRVTDLGDRVCVDLLGFGLAGEHGGSLALESPVASAVRWAAHGDDIDPDFPYTTRVVLDLKPGKTLADNVSVLGDPNGYTVTLTLKSDSPTANRPTKPQDPTAYTVALDAGHGGWASGAAYEDILEKDLTLPMTLRAGELLEEMGYNVVMVRPEDVFMDLYDRCDIANQAEADIFISIHCNASATSDTFQGVFTYSYPGSEKGEALAQCIQDEVVAATGALDRGLLTNNYVVLRETYMPAALLETGFMSCSEELHRLADPAYQEKIAQGVAAGAERYLATLPPKGAKEPSPPPRPGHIEIILPSAD